MQSLVCLSETGFPGARALIMPPIQRAGYRERHEAIADLSYFPLSVHISQRPCQFTCVMIHARREGRNVTSPAFVGSFSPSCTPSDLAFFFVADLGEDPVALI